MGRREASVPAVLFLAVVISASRGSEGLSLPPLEVSPTISVAGPLPMKGEVTPPVQNTLSPRTRVTSPFLEILTPQLLGGKVDPSISPIPASRPSVHHKRYDIPVAAPPMEMAYHSPSKHSPSIHHEIYDLSPTIPPIPHEIPSKDLSPRIPPIPHEGTKSHVSVPPRPFSKPSPNQTLRAPLLAPTSSISFHNHHARKKGRAQSAHSPIPAHYSPPTEHEVSMIPPIHSHSPAFKKSRQRPHSLPPLHQGPFSSTWSPISPKVEEGAHASSPSIMVPSNLMDTSISPIPASRPLVHHKRYDMPVVAPLMEMAYLSPSKHSPSIHHKIYGMPVVAPPKEMFNQLPTSKRHPSKDLSPTIPPIPHEIPFKDLSPRMPPIPHEGTKSHVSVPPRPFSKPSPSQTLRAPLLAPTSSISFHNHHARKKGRAHSPIPAHSSPPTEHEVSVIPPVHSHPPAFKKSRQRPHSLPPSHQGPSSSTWSPISPKMEEGAHAPSPSIMVPSSLRPLHSPSTIRSPPIIARVPVPPPFHSLPPPPPNEDCAALTCSEPLTNTLLGSPCGCIWPMQIGLRLYTAPYTFFPLVSELAQEIAADIFMKQSQVRIMGANPDIQQPDKTVVLIDLVPVGEKFDKTTAFLTYQKFWLKQVAIKANFFGNYDVLYVRYPGLPPSPPMAPSNITIDESPLANNNNGRVIQPLGVDVRKKRREKLGGSLIAVIALSSAIVLVLCIGAAWLLMMKCRHGGHELSSPPLILVPPGKSIGGGGYTVPGTGPSSASLSFSSSIATYAGSAKTFTLGEIERATDNFDDLTILGEGGFGRVYRGILEDGTKVAVKVLKRDDQQGSREFLAEVEMLSRLHHRNLVKLLGICTEENRRCLVYELIPNGSVESHLHGVDKKNSPLDWGARMKIALGSARALAYLHEDSSPRVIHRDFKSSNILLEYDFTPKVSDFGLARSAVEEGNEHISTRVMGTFGYVAPEYAMTGHLLVKSDVYSYGVVLLELLTGRKPVDMSQPPGQENLVTWARPLLTSQEGLEAITDPALGSTFPFDSVAKVAAIASMCVQPEVSQRPFMGEVVQALKLVCNETDGKKDGSGSCSQEIAQDVEARVSSASSQMPETRLFLTADYDSGLQAERALSTSDIFSTSGRFMRQGSESFRRHSSSGPLKTSTKQFLGRSFLRGSMSEHGAARKLWKRVSEGGRRWPS